MFDIEQSVVFALSKAAQCVSAGFREEFKEYRITQPQFILMAILWKTDGLSQNELSKRTRIDRSTLGGIIDRLEEAEFVERKSVPQDHRANRVWLTAKGRHLEEDLRCAAYSVRDRIDGRLNRGEYEQLKRLLDKLLVGSHSAGD